MQTPIEKATQIVTNPQQYAGFPSVLGDSWAKLKEARGQRVRFDRIGEPAYVIGPECPSITAARIARIAVKVRMIAREKGYDLPPSVA